MWVFDALTKEERRKSIFALIDIFILVRRSDGGFFHQQAADHMGHAPQRPCMAKVGTDQGPAAVCRDVRRGTKCITVAHSDGL
ncbi:hypothetical protein CH63R_05544 [Colletotrichum higginsianum IMI 349063]|uniref:Uncharacterized protein n=1 Tax=Colletotrichum higginsianum (strain IMI 349063) TaxID=759273 RepID=A0A1B7YCR5_COLHI|nr:hypothetical protein CH63R_05544 [Colletotrichum higginsianum IMI 349063]OBR09852.1 hypothetical protein CH63R_05544 [Colletotrichum higginsianum IMI 349063]